MSEINKKLVSVFKKLQNFDENSNKFTKLSVLYGKLDLTDNLLTQIHNDFETNKEDFKKLRFFKNTNIEEVYNRLDYNDKTFISATLQSVYEDAKKLIMYGKQEEEHVHNEDCSHTQDIMQNKQIKKLLSKNGSRSILQKELSKQFGIKNGNLEEMLQKVMQESDLPEGQMSMINNVLKNPMVKEISDKLFNEENMNKIKDILEKFMEDSEILAEVEHFKMIFNEEKVKRVINNIFEKIKDFNISDMSEIESFMENNVELKEIIATFEKSMKNGLINQERITKIIQKSSDKFFTEFKELNILSGKNMSLISTLLNQFGGDYVGDLFGDKKEEKKLTKKERRQKAQKKYRREQKKKLKGKKNKKRN